MLTKLSSLFEVQYGHSLELNRLELSSLGRGIPFVSRKMGDNGVAAYVRRLPHLEPLPGGTLTCALSGNGVLSTFIQDEPYYTGFHVACLTPKESLSRAELLFYSVAIRANRYRFSWGRQANRTLKELLLPDRDAVPGWVQLGSVHDELSTKAQALAALSTLAPAGRSSALGPKRVLISDLFDVVYGHSLELNRLDRSPYGINFVSRTAKANGVSARVAPLDGVTPAQAGTLTVAGGGSVLETFVQDAPFYSGRDLYWLIPRTELTLEEKLFYCAAIRSNRFRYNYGRQANRTLGTLLVPHPDEVPLWVYGQLARIGSDWGRKIATL